MPVGTSKTPRIPQTCYAVFSLSALSRSKLVVVRRYPLCSRELAYKVAGGREGSQLVGCLPCVWMPSSSVAAAGLEIFWKYYNSLSQNTILCTDQSSYLRWL